MALLNLHNGHPSAKLYIMVSLENQYAFQVYIFCKYMYCVICIRFCDVFFISMNIVNKYYLSIYT